MMANPFQTIGLTKPIVSMLLRDPERLRSFIKQYRREMGRHANVDLNPKAQLSEVQHINEAFEVLDRASLSGLSDLAEEYLQEGEQERTGLLFELRGANARADRLAEEIIRVKAETNSIVAKRSEENVNLIGKLVNLINVFELDLKRPEDTGVLPADLRGTIFLSLNKITYSGRKDLQFRPVRAISVSILYVDLACRLWNTVFRREFLGSYIGSPEARSRVVAASSNPYEDAAMEQVKIELEPIINDVQLNGPGKGWSDRGILIGQFRHFVTLKETSITMLYGIDLGIKGDSFKKLSVEEALGQYIRDNISCLVNLGQNQNSLALLQPKSIRNVCEGLSYAEISLHWINVVSDSRIPHLVLPRS